MKRRLFVPEVVQTSAMDCGPACLSALLGGFGLQASYGRLREACQTGIDGTNIDTLENLANRLGLEAEQIVIPPDHVCLPEAAVLPAIAVVRLPSGVTHLVVLWRRHGRYLQIMDPAIGRRFVIFNEFISELLIHQMPVPPSAWCAFAESPEFVNALTARIQNLGISATEARLFIERSVARPDWHAIAALDAAVRMVHDLAKVNGVASATQASELLQGLLRRALESEADARSVIPSQYWTLETGGAQLVMRGAVLVRAIRRRASAIELANLPPEVAAAVTEPPIPPPLRLWRMLNAPPTAGVDGPVRSRLRNVLIPITVVAALLISAAGIVMQGLLFRGLIGGARDPSGGSQHTAIVIATLLLLLILTAVEIPAISLLAEMGRRLEMRFREAFLQKLPRIADAFFHSRLTSDMAERSHAVYRLRALPGIAGQLLHTAFQLVLTTAAIIWIDPGLWPVAILSAALSVALPILFQPLLGERELRVRTHAGALSRFYLDSLLGLIPIRTHGGAAAVRREHRQLLRKWTSSALGTQKLAVALDGMQMFAGFGLAAMLTILHVARYGESAALLLVAYWSLNIPSLGRDLAALASQLPLYRTIALRLLEPLDALESPALEGPAVEVLSPAETAVPPTIVAPARQARGIALSLRNVSMTAGGHRVLHDLTLEFSAGSHIAIVGPSGAGKSSLIGLLLGWNIAETGAVYADGEPLTPEKLATIRREAAWIDPLVQLWNRPLIDNLRFGLSGDPSVPLGKAIEDAELLSLIDKLVDGFHTALGESGALVSGGEGQRIRIARAILRPNVRLAVLDEPFRGLDRETRHLLLRRLRAAWRDATLFFVSHEIAETKSFDRVLVIQHGTVVEDGAPATLAKTPGSHYAALLAREAELKQRLLEGADWRRVRMEQGVLTEQSVPTISAPIPAARRGERIA